MMLRVAALAAVLASATALPQVKIGLTTFDGAAATTQTWRSENDPVMGGVSVGSFKLDRAAKTGSWTGEVKIVPSLKAPGFCTVRTQHNFPTIAAAEGLLVTAKATGELKKLKVSMESSVRSGPRQGEFEGTFELTSQMATHFIPFSSMSQSYRGQKEGGPPTKAQLAKITGLGLNEDGVAGKFDFEILSIAAGSKSGPDPGPSPPGPNPSNMLYLAGFKNGKAEGATWQAVNDPVMGGRSTGSVAVDNDHAIWKGDVKVVPSLKAPGFCRLQGSIAKKDLSSFDGLIFDISGTGAPTGKTLMAVIENAGFLHSGQWTAPITVTGSRSQAFVAWESFKPFTIRPEPGSAPNKEHLKEIHQIGLLADGTAGEFGIVLHSIAAVGRPGPKPPSPEEGAVLFKFGGAEAKAWKVTNDPVMGGRSKSHFTVGTDGAGNKDIGLFTGDVAIVPSLKAPGFCNSFVTIPNADASEYDAIEITVRSHGPLTAFKSSWGGKGVPKDPNCHHPGCQYQTGSFKAGFNVTQTSASAAPQKIVIPFTDYTYEWSDFTGGCTDHGAKCCDPEASPNTCPSKTALSQITQIGIWGEGTAGDFALDIFEVRAVKMQ